ncbi:hypothetical protein EV359DRAFT_67898 [Lentinula novae-zelandiae]|nr:hypothetical protein EV359DRAFT_67898 [Lentinula novae-zelandiae]
MLSSAKLAGELPVVTPNHEETKPLASMPQSIEPTWLPHTSLVLKPSSDANQVALRIIIERKTLKTGFSSVVLAAFGLDYSEESIKEAKRLVANFDYIYQLLPSGDYDYSQPFSHNVIDKYLSAAIFSSTKYLRLLTSKKATIFRSSFPQKPLELELPKAMVAMAALCDHAKSVEENFPPTGLHSLWTTFIAVLTNLETASRVNYHQLMHKLYLKSTHFVAPTQHGLSQD